MRVFLEISVRLKLTVPLAAGAIGLAINSLPVMAGDGAMPIGEPAAAVAIEALPQSDAPLAAKVEAPIPTAAPDTTAASSAPAVEVAPVAVIAPSIESDAPLAAKVEAPIPPAAPDTTVASCAPAVEAAAASKTLQLSWERTARAKAEIPLPRAAPQQTIHEIPAQASTSERKGSQRLAAVMDEPGPRYMSDGRRYDPSIIFTHEGFIIGFLQRNFSVPSGGTYYPADH